VRLNFGNPVVLESISFSLGALSTIIDGYKVYRFGVKVLAAQRTRAALRDYINVRRNQPNLTPEQVWLQIENVYLVEELISSAKRMPVENVPGWFENAYAAYLLIGYPQSRTIRQVLGHAIALSASSN
jgi:hypothetical protein